MAIDLSLISGIPLKLDERGLRAYFSKGLRSDPPELRTTQEMADVLLESPSGSQDLYKMYRNVRFPADEDILRSHRLRYDITLLRGGLIGREFMKTLGHYHPMLPGLGTSYPELYEVLKGGAVYLLQKPRSLADPRMVADVVEVRAREGDRLIIPPEYGHITINPYKTTLVMADVTVDGFRPVYDPYRRLGGGSYHLVLRGSKPQWEPNSKYSRLPQIRSFEPRHYPELGLTRSRATYPALVERPEDFSFLTKPHRHRSFLAKLLR